VAANAYIGFFLIKYTDIMMSNMGFFFIFRDSIDFISLTLMVFNFSFSIKWSILTHQKYVESKKFTSLISNSNSIMIRESLVNELTTESFVLEEDKIRAPLKETMEFNNEIDNRVIERKGIINNYNSIGRKCTKSTEND